MNILGLRIFPAPFTATEHARGDSVTALVDQAGAAAASDLRSLRR